MVKFRIVGDDNYVSTLEETGGIYTLTSYHILQAENPLDPMEGVPVVTQVTVRNMQVDTEGNCFAIVDMEFIDLTTNGVFAEGTVDLMNKSEDFPAWEVGSSNIDPIVDGSLHNVNTGDVVVTISSAGVTGIGLETNKPVLPVLGEVISRGISVPIARRILTAVVGAVQTVTAGEPTVVTYRKDPFKSSGPYYNQRSSDAESVVYGSSNAETDSNLTITDSRHYWEQLIATRASAREFNIQIGGDVWTGSVILPISVAEAQPRPLLTLLRGTNGVVAGLATTQLLPANLADATAVTVSQSSVSAKQAAVAAADLTGSLTFQKLTKKNLNA